MPRGIYTRRRRNTRISQVAAQDRRLTKEANAVARETRNAAQALLNIAQIQTRSESRRMDQQILRALAETLF